MSSDGKTWAGRRVLVTGAGGFIGSHVVEQLASRGAEVRAFLRYNSGRRDGNLQFLDSAVRDRVECLYGDLRDLEAVREASAGRDILFHLGASISIPYSYAHPVEVLETNVGGTMNMLLAARELGVQRIVLTSTSEVYGTAQYAPIDERHPLSPQSPYAATKVAADMLGLAFQRSYGTPVVIVRPFNTYGPRQSMRAIIPTIITQALTQDVVRLGSLHPTRDFLFVEDAVQAFLMAALHEAAVGEVISFGYGETISIGDLAAQIIELVGRPVRVMSEEDRVRPTQSEVLRLHADHSKAERLLGWTPEVPLREGLQRTIAWITEHLSEFKPSVYYT